MTILIAFAFLAGVVTVLSPCILPILPIVLSGTVTGGKRRPWGIVTGFILSFTFFTLFLSAIVRATGVSPDVMRTLSVLIIGLFGVSLLIPRAQVWLEQVFSRLASKAPLGKQRQGFGGGVLIGLSLGLVWTPCVGPILASVISLALSGSVTGSAVVITLAYSLGTAIPMLGIAYGGRALLQKVPWLVRNTGIIQKLFGVLMILVALAIQFNYDRKFQAYVLTKFPQYGVGLTKFEDKEAVRKQLEDMSGQPAEFRQKDIGKPMTQFMDPLVARDLGQAPELIAGGEWFNSEPFTLESLRGKVVLVDFWTYTCINCIRTFPFLRAWHEKYVDKGLVIIGVHAPEFEFEKNPENVKKAIKDYGLKYPIMQDNDFATWRAYNNRYWPAEYFIDKNGHIRRTHFGEGDYDESEKVLQALLAETGADIGNTPTVKQDYSINARTPELYLGYDRIEYLASSEKIQRGTPALYSLPKVIPENHFAFAGTWAIEGEYAHPYRDSSLWLRFEAKEVFLVMRPKVQNKPGKIQVLFEGPGGEQSDYFGEDVHDGMVIVDSDRLYKLIKFDEGMSQTLILRFLDDNIDLYAFTFG